MNFRKKKKKSSVLKSLELTGSLWPTDCNKAIFDALSRNTTLECLYLAGDYIFVFEFFLKKNWFDNQKITGQKISSIHVSNMFSLNRTLTNIEFISLFFRYSDYI